MQEVVGAIRTKRKSLGGKVTITVLPLRVNAVLLCAFQIFQRLPIFSGTFEKSTETVCSLASIFVTITPTAVSG